MRPSWISFTCIAIIGSLSISAFGDEENVYRYKDKDGNMVMSNTIPSDVADQGYEIISPRGNVIETVAPRKTAAEVANENAQKEQQAATQKQAEAAHEAAVAQYKKDQILLQSFSSEEDIVRSRDEKIASIKVLEEIIHENIGRLQKQLMEAKNSAAAYATSHQAIPEGLQKTIDDTQRQISDNTVFLQHKLQEQKQIFTDYEDLLNRFHQLKTKLPADTTPPATPATQALPANHPNTTTPAP